jgi:8-oxo-dGTP pyrophosphatase MutT (NUDIX family)
LPPFRKLTEREIHRGHLITLSSARFVGPDGDEFDREIVRHPGAVSCVPVIDGTTAVLVRQYRAAIESDLLEIPAGKRDVEGEAPELTAHRELEEEIGMRAGRMVKLAEFHNSPGFTDEHSFVYLGLDLTEVGPPDPQGPEEQVMTIERIALDDVPELIATGRLIDAKSIIGLLLAREHLAGR